jgi:hypothetical protein
MTAPVAEMTYFDSGTIEYPTYRVVAAKDYSDGSTGEGRSSALYAYVGILVREREREREGERKRSGRFNIKLLS